MTLLWIIMLTNRRRPLIKRRLFIFLSSQSVARWVSPGKFIEEQARRKGKPFAMSFEVAVIQIYFHQNYPFALSICSQAAITCATLCRNKASVSVTDTLYGNSPVWKGSDRHQLIGAQWHLTSLLLICPHRQESFSAWIRFLFSIERSDRAESGWLRVSNNTIFSASLNSSN